MKKNYFLLLIIVMIFNACKHESNTFDDQLLQTLNSVAKTGDYSYFIFPESDDYQAYPNQDSQNPITEKKVELGKFLFHETGLSQIPFKDNCKETYSCSSCHIANSGFLPGRMQGIADGGEGFGIDGSFRQMVDGYEESDLDAQGTRPMNPINSGYSTNTLWSGLFGADGVNAGTEDKWVGLAEVNKLGYAGLETQNIEAFSLHRLEINDHVLDDYGYRELFDEAFPTISEASRYTPITASFAISAYLRSILANEAPFQKYLKGNEGALSANQKDGAMLFFGKAGCYKCHNSPALSSMTFHRMGTKDMYEFGGLNTGPDDPRNLGRGMFTENPDDNYKFKVPQLYNLKDYAAYFHGSSKTTLRELLKFKVKAESENPNVSNEDLSPFFRSVNLTDDEFNNLLEFLTNSLYDSNISRYVPEAIPSGNCFPNNDPMSKSQLGCN